MVKLEGWDIWQRKEGVINHSTWIHHHRQNSFPHHADPIPEEITNYTVLFIEAKKVGLNCLQM